MQNATNTTINETIILTDEQQASAKMAEITANNPASDLNLKSTLSTEEVLDEGISFAPLVNGSINWKKRIRVNAIQKFWSDTIGTELLEEDETVRVTAILPYTDSKGNKVDTQRTLKDQIRSSEELIEVMARGYESIHDVADKALVGWSMSSAVFKVNPDPKGGFLPPNTNSFNTIKNMVIDLDAYTSENGKDGGRFNFNQYTTASRRVIAIQSLLEMNKVIEESGYGVKLFAKNVYATGGGLQFVIEFEKALDVKEARLIFGYFKVSMARAVKERFQVLGFDNMGDKKKGWFEFDNTSTDITHTQRLGGTVNPKAAYHGAFSEEIVDFYNEDLIDEAIINMKKEVDEADETMVGGVYVLDPELNEKVLTGAKIIDTGVDKERKKELKATLNEFSLKFKKYLVDIDVQIRYEVVFAYKRNIESAQKILETGHGDLAKTAGDYDIIKQIPIDSQIAYMENWLEGSVESNFKYNVYQCPFHPGEKNGSFSILKDTNVAFAKDFHPDGKTYNLITFVMAVKDVSRPSVIHDLEVMFDLTIKQSDRKAAHKESVVNDMMDYINDIDVENFVYYRLANKQRACIIRAFEQGEAYVFDGTRMLSDHILANQLKMRHADMETRAVFHELFVEHVLINAFEEFTPGKPYTYERNFIQYVNLWIPGKEYLKIHELAENIDEMDIAAALGLIKERLPHMWFYLNQMTQKGSIEYFVNWLVCVSDFETMSTIPIVTSVQGSGKGVFVTQVLEYYLNHEYVNIVNAEKVANNFNAFMEKSSLIVLDEGEFSKTHDVDNLKMLTGNKYIQVEKKGIDSMKVERHFNMLMLTNGEVPLSHPSNDRRMSYFRCDVPLVDSIKHHGFDYIDDFIDELKDEVQEFWAIMVKTKAKKEWKNMNLKDNQFNKQILMMHPFGKLVIDIIDGKWTDIKLQMNENIDDHLVITSNLEMIDLIKASFDSTGMIDLTLINKYIKSLPFKSYKSVLQFIKVNNLELNGISIVSNNVSVKIKIDKHKVLALTKMSNNLGNLFDVYKDDVITDTLNAVRVSAADANAKTLKILEEPLEVGLAVHDTSDPLGIMKPPSPNTVSQ